MTSTYVTYEATFPSAAVDPMEAVNRAAESFEEKYDEEISGINLTHNTDVYSYEITINGDS